MGERKGRQGTCMKDPWTKSKGGRIKSGRWGWGMEENGGGKMEKTVLGQ